LGYTDDDVKTARAFDMMDLYLIKLAALEFRERAQRLPDFTRTPVLGREFSFPSIGCKDANDPRFFCHAAKCLTDKDEVFPDLNGPNMRYHNSFFGSSSTLRP
jgi:hypothetical protein